MEVWKDIKDYEGYYQVSNLGNIRSLTREVRNNLGTNTVFGQKISPFMNQSGYLQVALSKEGNRERPYVHRLVAEAFISNPRNLSEVNHIDHNKLNCSVENLEWCTRKENMIASAIFYGVRKEKYFCSCGNEVVKKGNKCNFCATRDSRVVKERPSPQELKKELQESSFVGVGKKYGVSDNAIRKWCKSYGMSTKSKDYKI